MKRACIALGIICTSTTALAAETISYSYDVKGRLVRVVHTGSVNNGVTTTYTHDKTDNRQRVVVGGAAR